MLYTIQKGEHAPFRFPKLFVGKRLWKWRIVMGKGCWTGTSPDHISKIVGVGFWPGHHDESLRLGWMEAEKPGTFHLFLYWYERGVRLAKKLDTVEEGVAFTFHIEVLGSRGNQVMAATIVDNSGSVATLGVKYSWLSYLLRPYYGGTGIAPNDMQILVEEIK